MAVVINELEVVVEDAPASPGEAQPGAPPPLSPLEMGELLERRARNALRLFAH
jgi:hypothetical protein